MPRLSLYKPEKGPDFRFLDRVINEQFQVGGTDIFVHKYLGVFNPTDEDQSPTRPGGVEDIGALGIQDLLFMENRDRKYSEDVYQMRGIYTMQDIDFNLSQFGLFLTNDNIMLTFHLRNTVDTLGRKIMAGDVLELPHLKDEYALDDARIALKRFYVVTDVTRPASGYSPTWYPHLLRAKCQPLVDSQEFADILKNDAGAGDGSTLRDLMSTYKQSIEINQQIIAQAQADSPESGYENGQFYVMPTIANGTMDLADTTDSDVDASSYFPDGQDDPTRPFDASMILRSPEKDYYVGYLTGDGVPPNGAAFGAGTEFPTSAVKGQFYLRQDFFPQRLFRYDGKNWIKFEDNVRMTLNNFGSEDVATGKLNAGAAVKQTQKSSFINNTNTATIAGAVVQEKQALSKALRIKPQADN